MRTHFHLLVWPEDDRQLPRFMHWLTATHALRWREATDTIGVRAPSIKDVTRRSRCKPTEHFLRVARYVERNPLRARLVEPSGGLALEQSVASKSRRGPLSVDRMAGRSTCGLARRRQSAADDGGAPGDQAVRDPRLRGRQRQLAEGGGEKSKGFPATSGRRGGRDVTTVDVSQFLRVSSQGIAISGNRPTPFLKSRTRRRGRG